MRGTNDLFTSFYISPDGNDEWSGTLAQPDAAGNDGPWATLDGARQRLRALKETCQLSGPVVVYLRGGTYPVKEPIEFSPEDSWPVVFAAYPDEEPIIDGGERIGGWTETQHRSRNVWVTHLPDVASGAWYFRSLFVNGQRRSRVRYPKQGLLKIEDVPGKQSRAPLFDGSDTFKYAPGDLTSSWHNLEDVEIVVPHFWISERMPIVELDEENRVVRSSRRSCFALTDDFTGRWAEYYVENVFEELSEPGEWYLDRTSGNLYYVPMLGEEIETTEVVAPRVDQFVRLIGNPQEDRHVQFLQFRGLTFVHGDWSPPAKEQFNEHIVDVELASAPQSAYNVGGAIQLEGAKNCAIEQCVIKHVGIYAIELRAGCSAIMIRGNEISDMGAGGVLINGADANGPEKLRTGHNRIVDNHIFQGGRVYHAGVGICARHAFDNEISRNHIHDLYYTAISVGWNWGYVPTVAANNRIEYNHIHDLGYGLINDMGGVYTLGVQPGTVVRGNLIYNVKAKNYGGWGVYLDEGSAHIIVENNLCFDTSSQIFNQHYGRENTIRNNIFAFGQDGLLSLGRAENHIAFTFEHNIVVTDGTPIFKAGYAGQLDRKAFRSDSNLYWDISGGHVCYRGRVSSKEGMNDFTLDELREMGYEHHSVQGDPGFVDAKGRDFNFADPSAAIAMGFVPFDWSRVGPKKAD